MFVKADICFDNFRKKHDEVSINRFALCKVLWIYANCMKWLGFACVFLSQLLESIESGGLQRNLLLVLKLQFVCFVFFQFFFSFRAFAVSKSVLHEFITRTKFVIVYNCVGRKPLSLISQMDTRLLAGWFGLSSMEYKTVPPNLLCAQL